MRLRWCQNPSFFTTVLFHHSSFDTGINMRYTPTHDREGSPMNFMVFLLFWYVICVGAIPDSAGVASMESRKACTSSRATYCPQTGRDDCWGCGSIRRCTVLY